MELYLIWLNMVFYNNYSAIYKLLDIFNSPEEIFSLPDNEWRNLNISENLLKRLTSCEFKVASENIYKKCISEDIKLLTFNSPNYPVNLKNIDYPPILLYYRGEITLDDQCAIAIVGSRNFTQYGKHVAEVLSAGLSRSRVTIVSGMARGIDSFAHLGALDNGGRTIAVLGSGINVIYPAENKYLYYKILENGAVISEFTPDTPPMSSNFPIRNRIVSGLSLGVVVVEADIKSGSIITARLAGEQGRDVFAVPGNIFTRQSFGTNALIKDGAKLVSSCDDILEELPLNMNPKSSHPIQLEIPCMPDLSDTQKKIFTLLCATPLHIDMILENLNVSLPELNSELTILELKGLIQKLAGNTYIKDSKYIDMS